MKKQVHYAYLEDMKKYIPGFNPEDYESTDEQTDSSVIAYAREYYNSHLPVDLTAWMRVNEPDDCLIYKKGFYEQIRFVNYTVCELFFTFEEWKKNPPMVISTHMSKSVKLPVYQINLKKYGIEMILRYNFYDWKISIKSDKPLEFDYMGLFNPDQKISSCYCEGFPDDKVYGSYSEDHSQFTIEIGSEYNLYTFMFLLRNYLGIRKEK